METATNPLLLAALRYAGRGWPCFPLLPGRKLPFAGADSTRPHVCPTGHAHQRGLLDATTDPAILTAWWTTHPTANIGLAPPADLVVLDGDCKDPAKDGLAYLAAHPELLPAGPTLTAATGTGGRHYFLRCPPEAGIRSSNSRLAPGLDVRAAGGYIVAPPSGHPNGQPYKWLSPKGTPLLAAPPALLERLVALQTTPAVSKMESAPPPRPAERQLGERLVGMALARLGQEGRNEAGLWLACQLRDNMFTAWEAEGPARDYVARCPQDTPGGRYTWREMEHSLQQVYRRAPRQPWRATLLDPEQVLAALEAADPPAPPVSILVLASGLAALPVDPATGELPVDLDKDALIALLSAQLTAARTAQAEAEAALAVAPNPPAETAA